MRAEKLSPFLSEVVMVARERFLVLHAAGADGRLHAVVGTADETVIDAFIRMLVRLTTRGGIVVEPADETPLEVADANAR